MPYVVPVVIMLIVLSPVLIPMMITAWHAGVGSDRRRSRGAARRRVVEE
jgi:hypothetical protein